MEKNEFKILFGDIAILNKFKKAFGGWYLISNECIIILELQKSNYGNYYELNIKVFVQGIFGQKYILNKNLVSRDMGDAYTRQPSQYNIYFDLDNPINSETRQQKLNHLFIEFIVPFSKEALSYQGLINLSLYQKLFLTPAVHEHLIILLSEKNFDKNC